MVSSSWEEPTHTQEGKAAARVRLHHTRARVSRQDLFWCLRRRGRADGKVTLPAPNGRRWARCRLSTVFPESGDGKGSGRFDGCAASCCLRQARRSCANRNPCQSGGAFTCAGILQLLPFSLLSLSLRTKEKHSHLLLTSSFLFPELVPRFPVPSGPLLTDGKRPPVRRADFCQEEHLRANADPSNS